MMKKIILSIIFLNLIGCFSDPSPYLAPTSNTNPVNGNIGLGKAAPYAEIVSWVTFKNQAYQRQFSTNLKKTTEVGQGCIHSIYGVVAWGNSGIENTKKEAGITKISLVEIEEQHFLFGTYRRHCTNVYGSKETGSSANIQPVQEKLASNLKRR
ncbi:MAG: hypothetical protein KDK36_18095 [Leptospiraceae bacterium]|nr:hypothetical protein [Leptospiraceae bacterium]